MSDLMNEESRKTGVRFESGNQEAMNKRFKCQSGSGLPGFLAS
jgi:hypothetical protein